jgi:hypothetical protein
MILQKRNEKRTNKIVNKHEIGIDKTIQNGGQEVIKEYNIKKKKVYTKTKEDSLIDIRLIKRLC